MTPALKNLKVLDFTSLLPGPYATQILADLGADVLRIELPSRPDILHQAPPFVGGVSAANASINRNKQSLALDLRQPEARQIIGKLLSSHDIIIEQFRPGVMARLGLGYEQIKAIRPDIIYCSITGYGQTGPMKDHAGHDINFLAVSGLASYSGRQDTGPVLSGTQIADIAGGSHQAVIGILAAVIHRNASGQGQHIDISMSDGALALTTFTGANALAGGDIPGPGTGLLNGGSFYDFYRTSDDRYLSVGALEPKFFDTMLKRMGLDQRVSRPADDQPASQQKLRAELAEAFRKKSAQQWLEVFAGADVCIELVQTLEEVRDCEQFQQRGMFVELPCSGGKSVTQVASPIAMSATPARYEHIGPAPGQDSVSILKELGYSRREIDSLLEKGVTVDGQASSEPD